MTIKHLVLCGGGPVGIVIYSAFKELINKNIINFKEIKSIYSTSIGAFISFIILLNIEWQWIDDFIIKRPWEELFNFSSIDYFNLFFTKGLCDKEFFINCLKSLFLTADIDINITLKEFYDLNKIEWHIFTSNLNKFTKVDLNYKTHPDLSVIDAITMSSSIPIIIKPPYYNNEYYLDGGLFCNNPANECLFTEKCLENEIFCFVNDKRNPIDLSNNYYKNIENEIINDEISNNILNENTNIFSFLIFIVKTIFKKVMVIENENTYNFKNSINVALTETTVDINYWYYVFSNKKEREYLMRLGICQANNYIFKNIYNNTNTYSIKFNDMSFNLNDCSFENII